MAQEGPYPAREIHTFCGDTLGGTKIGTDGVNEFLRSLYHSGANLLVLVEDDKVTVRFGSCRIEIQR